MRYLIDTHILLWWLSGDSLLKPKIKKIIASEAVWVSTAVIWEIVIKTQLGKLSIPGNLEEELRKQGFNILDIKIAHVFGLQRLESHHSDPFNHIQIAQAANEGLTFITKDKHVQKYSGVDILNA